MNAKREKELKELLLGATKDEKLAKELTEIVGRYFDYLTRTATAKEMAQSISEFVNCYDTSKVIKCGTLLAEDHRTLQQSVMRMAVAFIRAEANNYTNKNYDMRNEQTAKIANTMVKAVPEDEFFLPFI